MIKNWLTIDECTALFRGKNADVSVRTTISYLSKYRHQVRRRYPGSVRTGQRQYYCADDVMRLVEEYRPVQPFTYRRETPPPEGWMTLREIAEYLGANQKRLEAICSHLSLPTCMYNRRRYTRLDMAEQYLPWRTCKFVRRYRTEAWIEARRKFQKTLPIKPPSIMLNTWSKPIYAPELIHL